MTAQQPDILIYKGIRLSLFANPLEDYYAQNPPRPDFGCRSTANDRGYVATWGIESDMLYLEDIDSEACHFKALLGSGGKKVRASWLSGILHVPLGDELQYVHQGYFSTYEYSLFLKIEKGLVTESTLYDNRRDERVCSDLELKVLLGISTRRQGHQCVDGGSIRSGHGSSGTRCAR